MAVDVVTVPFAEVRKFVESTFRQVADLKGLEFEVSLDSALPPAIQTDTKRLQQVLKNLLSNAFKFTAQGGVRLEVTAALGGWSVEHPVLNQAPTVVSFEVSDTGIGIAPVDQDKIFEDFRQLDNSPTRAYGGTGLGLSICRSLAQMIAGRISLQSQVGKGSTFTLTLPFKGRR
jgi:signal transduction histidine kinase